VTQFDFAERMEVSAKAKHIADAVDEYLKRADKWYSKPSVKSKAAAEFLRTVRSDRNLVEETRFRVGQVAASPFHTPPAEQLDNGELKKRLVEALAKT
jgi:hypothetical protein